LSGKTYDHDPRDASRAAGLLRTHAARRWSDDQIPQVSSSGLSPHVPNRPGTMSPG
jgi:hypothetical protein